MKITITAYGESHSTELDEDATAPQAMRAFVNLMVNASYQKSNFTEMLKDGDPNLWVDAWPDITD